MLLDLEQELLTHIDTKITTDTELLGYIGNDTLQIPNVGEKSVPANERLFNVLAPEDIPYPYLVHRFTHGATLEGVVSNGAWLLNVYDYKSNAARVFSIRNRIIRMFMFLRLQGDSFKNLEFWKERDEFIETDNQEVWKWEIVYSLRYANTGEFIDKDFYPYSYEK